MLIQIFGIIGGFFILSLIFKEPVRGIYLAVLFLPITIIPIIGTRIVISDLFILMAFFGFLFNLLKGRIKIRPVKKGLFISLFVFYLAAAASFLNVVSPKAGAMEFLPYLYGGIFLFILFQLADDSEKLLSVIRCIIISFIIVTLFGLIQIMVLRTVYEWCFAASHIMGITSTFRWPNQLPSYVAPLLPLFLLFLVKAKKRLTYYSLVVLIFASTYILLMTASRTGILMLISGFIGFMIWKFRDIAAPKFGFLVILFTAFLLGFCFFSHLKGFLYVTRPLQAVSNFNQTIAEPFRLDQFHACLDIILKHPLLGVGVGNFPIYFDHNFTYGAYELHNTYLGVLSETGLLGFSALSVFLFFIAKEMWKAVFRAQNNSLAEIGTAIAIGIIPLLMYGLFHFGLRQRHFWFFIGLLLLINEVNFSNNKETRPDMGKK